MIYKFPGKKTYDIDGKTFFIEAIEIEAASKEEATAKFIAQYPEHAWRFPEND